MKRGRATFRFRPTLSTYEPLGATVRPMKAVQMFAQVVNTLSISQLHQLAYLLHDDLDNHGHEMTAEQIEAHRRALRAMRAEIDLLSH